MYARGIFVFRGTYCVDFLKIALELIFLYKVILKSF